MSNETGADAGSSAAKPAARPSADTGASAGMELWRHLFYRFVQVCTGLLIIVLFRLRVIGRGNVPGRGPVLLVCNHQSHLDPPLVGVALWTRQVVPLARIGLFDRKLFSWFIRMLNAIPLKQGEADTKAIRSALDALGRGRCVLIFAEGSRTWDGRLQRFQPGVWLLLRRAGCPVVPVAVEGAFDAFRRGQKRPRFFGQRAVVAFGEPIEAKTLSAMGREAGMLELERRVEMLRRQGADLIRSATDGRLPTTHDVDVDSVGAVDRRDALDESVA